MKRLLYTIGFIVLVIVGYVFWPSLLSVFEGQAPPPVAAKPIKTDTAKVRHIAPILVTKPTPAKKVRIQRTPDTLERRRREKATIVRGAKLDFTRSKYDIQKITPRGTIIESSYNFDPETVKTIIVSDTGSLEVVQKTDKELLQQFRRERRRRRWRTVKRTAVTGAAAYTAYRLGKSDTFNKFGLGFKVKF
ncbi:hypothetical protein SAMN05421780_103263 [Flexibacter flexilis DSM 6793]|uniref:Uncharacterized protein n=1 Tax=Flexibacter flexilis DSM 6793 TaxID=927664 RepID=A0A1I1H953_9BACT|nr:hypothetical protein [Flexibacter flexilis]SFC20689.1 hypothetical protein SAMN05421780_103263 [Flexibacter flexilis DSM 6793]